MRGRAERVRLDVVVRVSEIVRHKAHDGEEDRKNHGQREDILDDVVGPEGNSVLFGLFLRRAAHFNSGGVVVAGGVEGPDMNDHQACDHKGQQVVQAEEAVERRVVHRRSAQKPGLDRLADKGDCAEETGNHGGAPEGHLTPRQHVPHKGSAHHQDEDQDADDPSDLARFLVGAIVKASEDVSINCHEEQRCAIHVQIPQHMPTVHVAHDVLDRCKGHVDMRRVMHRQHDAGGDLQCQTEGQDDAPDPHPVQVLGRGDHQCVV